MMWHKDVVCSEGRGVILRMLGGALMQYSTRNIGVQRRVQCDTEDVGWSTDAGWHQEY